MSCTCMIVNIMEMGHKEIEKTNMYSLITLDSIISTIKQAGYPGLFVLTGSFSHTPKLEIFM